MDLQSFYEYVDDLRLKGLSMSSAVKKYCKENNCENRFNSLRGRYYRYNKRNESLKLVKVEVPTNTEKESKKKSLFSRIYNYFFGDIDL